MPVYEARATLYAVRHQLRKVGNHGKRHLVLSDSMTATLAFSKGRAHGHRLRRVVQQTSAYLLATGSNLVVRWVPSEWNPADNPSRGKWVALEPCPRPCNGPLPGSASAGVMAGSCEEGEPEAESGPCRAASDATELAYPGGMGSRNVEGTLCSEEETKSYAETSKKEAAANLGVRGPADVVGGASYPPAVPNDESQLRGMATEKQEPQHVLGPRELLGRNLPGGRRFDAGNLHRGCLGSLRARDEEPARHGTGAANLEGMETYVSTSQQNAAALRGDMPGRCRGHQVRATRNRAGVTSHILALPSADGVRDLEDSGHCQADQRGQGGLPALERAVAPLGGRGSFEDSAVGRSLDSRPQSHEVLGAGHEQSAPPSKQTEEPVELQRHQPAGHRLHEKGVEAARPFGSGRTAHVSPAAWGRDIRTGQQTPKRARSSASRAVESNKEPQELRKGRPPGPIVRQSAESRAEKVHRGAKQPRQAPTQPALKPARSLKLLVFLEIFSGSGRLGRAVGRVVGMAVLLWDITFGPEYDLTNPSIQHKILEWIRTGYVVAGHLGTPCGSFSRARDQPGGPPRLRSDEFPLGLAQLRPHDAKKVAIGNILMRFSIRVMLMALRMLLPFTLENPARSRLWICPPVRALLRRKYVAAQQVEYCSFGMPWKKSTLFVAVHVNLEPLSPHRCIGAKRGLCKYTGHAHVPLMGQLPDGRWMTHVAEPYPRKLCTVVAGCFRDVFVQRIADNFAQHLGSLSENQ